MSTYVLFDSVNELRKREHFIRFRNEFNKFNNPGARMIDSIYHMTLRLLCTNRCS